MNKIIKEKSKLGNKKKCFNKIISKQAENIISNLSVEIIFLSIWNSSIKLRQVSHVANKRQSILKLKRLYYQFIVTEIGITKEKSNYQGIFFFLMNFELPFNNYLLVYKYI